MVISSYGIKHKVCTSFLTPCNFNQIDISQYQGIVDKAAAPVRRYETEQVFDMIETAIEDVYSIGGAFVDCRKPSTGSRR